MMQSTRGVLRYRWLLLGALLGVSGCGGDENCKGACDIISGCGLKSSGLSCDEACDQGDCAACVNDTECADIESGACNADCPGVSFSKDDSKK